MWNVIFMELLLLLQLSYSQDDTRSGSLSAFEALDDLRTQAMSGHTSTIDDIRRVMSTAQPGATYPTLSVIPETSFSCDQVNQSGYYADPETGCQAYRQCLSGAPMYSFLCPNKTLFNQITLVCDWWYNVNCDKSISYYSYSNPRLYQEHVLFLYDNGTSAHDRSNAVGLSSPLDGSTDAESSTSSPDDGPTTEGGADESSANPESTTEVPADTETTESGATGQEENTTDNQETTTENDLSESTTEFSTASPDAEATTSDGVDVTTEGILFDSGSSNSSMSSGDESSTESSSEVSTVANEESTTEAESTTEQPGSISTEPPEAATEGAEVTTVTPSEEVTTMAEPDMIEGTVGSSTGIVTTTGRAGIVFTVPTVATILMPTTTSATLRIGRVSRALVGFIPVHSSGNEIQPTANSDLLTTIYPTGQIQKLYTAEGLDSSKSSPSQTPLGSGLPTFQWQLTGPFNATALNSSQPDGSSNAMQATNLTDPTLATFSGQMYSGNQTDHTVDFWGSQYSTTGNDQEPTLSWMIDAVRGTTVNDTEEVHVLQLNQTILNSSLDANMSSTVYVVNLTDILTAMANNGSAIAASASVSNIHTLEIGDSVSSPFNSNISNNSAIMDMFGNILTDSAGNVTNMSIETWTLPVNMDMWMNASDAGNTTSTNDTSLDPNNFWGTTTKALRTDSTSNSVTLPPSPDILLGAMPSRNFSSGLETASSTFGKSVGSNTGTFVFAFIPDGNRPILPTYTNLNALLLALQSTLRDRLNTTSTDAPTGAPTDAPTVISATLANRLTLGPLRDFSGSFQPNMSTALPMLPELASSVASDDDNHNLTLTTDGSQYTDAILISTANATLQFALDTANVTLINATVVNITSV
ncbi:mucin-19-like isoform X2 [Paramacrobiotus metropolitanus]|uniref:mucin-19-like isoform X2 n=1 Tax=Paramacrobiotus metropolitanus TaxID=2943436 RepID=UPI002445A774|nr:mucin-19-like isoform X2 [Paramacrobiotus metropolitanus]